MDSEDTEDRSSIFYFCHVCNARKLSSQVTENENGEITCNGCGNAGFVEKINLVIPISQSAIDRLREGDVIRENVNAYRPSVVNNQVQTFTSVMGVPIRNFVQDLFQMGNSAQPENLSGRLGSSLGSLSSLLTGDTLDVHFGGEGLNAQDPPAASTNTSQNGSNAARQVDPHQLELSNIVRSFIQNPLDQRVMGHILQYVMDSDTYQYGSPPASHYVVKKLKRKIVTKQMLDGLGNCAICTEDYVEGDHVLWMNPDRRLCGHVFHINCIIPWLREHNSCPVCRYQLPIEDDAYTKQRDYLRHRISLEVQRAFSGQQSTSESRPNQDRKSVV